MMKHRRKIWTGILAGILIWGTAELPAAEIRVNPDMGSTEITSLLQSAGAGDSILFGPGTYRGPFRLEGVKGVVNRPVVIRGSGAESCIIDNGIAPGINLQEQAFVLTECAWIRIEGFRIRNCWTDLVLAKNSSYISLRHCRLEGGKRALFAKGRGSHHFLVEHCSWEQDPRVWTHEGDYSWDEIHHGILRHYNGSIFQGSGISGVFVVRDNQVRNTFNAFRLSQVNDGSLDRLACSNGEIYRNEVWNTSDNVLEPEVHALNLHYYHNHMVNGHAFVSITEVRGGDIYIYGNTAVSLPESEDGWTVFKISSGRDSLEKPLYIYNNSWQVDFDMIGSPRHVWENSHVKHFNNACYSEASDSFGIYFLGEHNHFDYDCSNVPFPSLLTHAGFEQHGLVADPLFRDAYGGDFRLQPGSPCIDRGLLDDRLLMGFEGKAPDLGAWDGDRLVEGPPFRFAEPEVEIPFREHPRITRHKLEKGALRLWFSVPLDGESIREAHFQVLLKGHSYPVESMYLEEDGYGLTLSGEALKALSRHEEPFLEVECSHWPAGRKAMALTTWASTLPFKQTQQ